MAGCLVEGCPISPLYDVGGCAVPSLGVDVRVYDSGIENTGGGNDTPPVGREVSDGEAGDLVVAKPMVSFPVFFWGDHHSITGVSEDEAMSRSGKGKGPGPKYRAAYFSRFAGVWTHGDFMYRDKDTGAYVILGRADGVLDPSGVRFGSAEIYGVIEREFGGVIEDSVCVGQRREGDGDERVLLFVKMRDGQRFDGGVVRRLKEAVKGALSRRHVPRFVFETGEIPVSLYNFPVSYAFFSNASAEVFFLFFLPTCSLVFDALTWHVDDN